MAVNGRQDNGSDCISCGSGNICMRTHLMPPVMNTPSQSIPFIFWSFAAWSLCRMSCGRRTWSRRRWCSCTGNGFVINSAILSTPCRHLTKNCPWCIRSGIQWNFMSVLLVLFGFTVSVAMPWAHLLSHRISVAGCGYPKALSVSRIDAASWPLRNRASATDATSAGII